MDYERLRALKDDIIMISMPGYGMNGPYRDRVAYGTTLEPEAGFSAMMGYADRGPMRLGVAYPDPVAGIHAAAAIVLALYHRARTEKGQYIELAQLETACSFIGDAIVRYQLTGELPQRHGNAHPGHAPYGCYPCAGDDRWITIAVRSDEEWQRLCGTMGQRDRASDRRFATAASRVAHRAEVDGFVRSWTRTRAMGDVMRQLQQAGIAAGAVNDARDMVEDEQLRARGFYIELEHPDAGRHIYPGQAIRLSKTPAVFRSDAPRLGGDTRAVLRDLLGVDEARYQHLADSGAVAEARVPGED
jgi:crotonobetainyl-CoA:carnitine CoA-transferase CaiB-like acyl-CoA transferase